MGGSITQGISRNLDGSFSLNGGYRPHLFGLALSDGKLLNFVGSMSDGPDAVAGQPFPKRHEGQAGWYVSPFSEIVPSPALSSNPDIVLLSAGMTDMSTENAAKAAGDLIELVGEISSNLPDSLIVISTLSNIFASSEALADFNATVRALASESDEDLIVIAELPWDTVTSHMYPPESSYRAIAQSWYSAIKPYL